MQSNSKLEQLLGRVFDGAREGLRDKVDLDEYEKRKHDFIFHMIDWRTDLEGLSDLLRHPQNYDENSASNFVIGFLYHVIPHLDAAGRLLLDKVSSPFLQEEEAKAYG